MDRDGSSTVPQKHVKALTKPHIR